MSLTKLSFGIGLDAIYRNVSLDVKSMGHVLIGGRSGCGKTTLTKNIVKQLIEEEDCNLYIIDPKRIDFVAFAERIPIVTEVDEVEILITEMVEMMENRYHKMSEEKTDKCDKKYQVLIIDELAALNQRLSKKCMIYLERLLQMGRAANIRVIIGTQRPDSRTISPQIKANITTVIALQTATSSNSRVLLDDKGAELLEKYHAIIRSDVFLKKEITLLPPIGEETKSNNKFIIGD